MPNGLLIEWKSQLGLLRSRLDRKELLHMELFRSMIDQGIRLYWGKAQADLPVCNKNEETDLYPTLVADR